jgi:hypothetical protein
VASVARTNMFSVAVRVIVAAPSGAAPANYSQPSFTGQLIRPSDEDADESDHHRASPRRRQAECLLPTHANHTERGMAWASETFSSPHTLSRTDRYVNYLEGDATEAGWPPDQTSTGGEISERSGILTISSTRT